MLKQLKFEKTEKYIPKHFFFEIYDKLEEETDNDRRLAIFHKSIELYFVLIICRL